MFSAWSNHESEYPSCEGHVSESREAETLCLNNTAVSTCHEGKNVSQHSKTWCSWYCRYWQFFAQESFSAWIHLMKWFVFQTLSVFGQTLTTFPDLTTSNDSWDKSLILGLIPLNKVWCFTLKCAFLIISPNIWISRSRFCGNVIEARCGFQCGFKATGMMNIFSRLPNRGSRKWGNIALHHQLWMSQEVCIDG